jgi:hypothetical protein
MPVRKVKGGWKVDNTKTVHKTKKKALAQLRAIKASKNKGSR